MSELTSTVTKLASREITRFVKRESAKAAAAGDDPRARAISFLMSLYSAPLGLQHTAKNANVRQVVHLTDDDICSRSDDDSDPSVGVPHSVSEKARSSRSERRRVSTT